MLQRKFRHREKRPMPQVLYGNTNQPIHATVDTTDQEIADRAVKLAYCLGINCPNLFAYVMKLERRIAVLEGRKE
jgi:hypothetical protein